MNANKALWEKGDFTRLASTMRESGDEVVAGLDVGAGMDVLDLGCGDGTTALPSAQRGANVLGVDIASNLVKAVVFERALTFSLTGAQMADLAWLTLLGWGRIVQFVMLGLLAAVTTRSLLAALFVPLVVGVGQFFLPKLLASMGVSPDGWLTPLLTPGMAADLLKAVILGGAAAGDLPPQALAKGVLGLVSWTLAPLVGAMVWFQRQDLSKE